jgi:hypothetical protein
LKLEGPSPDSRASVTLEAAGALLYAAAAAEAAGDAARADRLRNCAAAIAWLAAKRAALRLPAHRPAVIFKEPGER